MVQNTDENGFLSLTKSSESSIKPWGWTLWSLQHNCSTWVHQEVLSCSNTPRGTPGEIWPTRATHVYWLSLFDSYQYFAPLLTGLSVLPDTCNKRSDLVLSVSITGVKQGRAQYCWLQHQSNYFGASKNFSLFCLAVLTNTIQCRYSLILLGSKVKSETWDYRSLRDNY